MAPRRVRGTVDYEGLSQYLKTLGVPSRLELMRQLQVPRAVSEIDVAPTREDDAGSRDRPISRQALENHLRKLEELDLVHARHGEREGRAVTEYVVNHARFFVVVDELRRLSLLRSSPGALTAETDSGGELARQNLDLLPKGPALVLVSAPLEGVAFTLDGAGPWRIGRERGLEVSLGYDPWTRCASFPAARRATSSSRRRAVINWVISPAPRRG